MPKGHHRRDKTLLTKPNQSLPHSLTSNGEKARYPPRDTSFLNDEYLRQKSYAAPLYKSVDLDFVIAETYREYPDRERDHIARGVKELKIAEFKKFLGEFEKWGNRQR